MCVYICIGSFQFTEERILEVTVSSVEDGEKLLKGLKQGAAQMMFMRDLLDYDWAKDFAPRVQVKTL